MSEPRGLFDQPRRNYFSINNGQFALKSSESDPRAVKRIKKTGEPIWEIRNSDFEGLLTDIRTKTHENFGAFLELDFLVGQDTYTFSAKLTSTASRSILLRLPNVDLENPLMIGAFEKEMQINNEMVKFNLVALRQDGQTIEKYYDESTLPPYKEVEFEGKKRIDKTPQLKYLLEKTNELVIPKLNELKAKRVITPPETTHQYQESLVQEAAAQPVGTHDEDDDLDDLPF